MARNNNLTLVEKVESLRSDAEAEAQRHREIVADLDLRIADLRAERAAHADNAVKADNIAGGLGTLVTGNGGGGVSQ